MSTCVFCGAELRLGEALRGVLRPRPLELMMLRIGGAMEHRKGRFVCICCEREAHRRARFMPGHARAEPGPSMTAMHSGAAPSRDDRTIRQPSASLRR